MAAAIAVSVGTFNALAATPYVGAALGEAETDVDGNVYDGEDSSFKVLGGWRWRWVALELSYFDLGTIKRRPVVPSVSGFRLEQEGYMASGVLLLDVGKVDLFASGGFVASESERILVFPTQEIGQTDHDWDVHYGVGAQIFFDRIALRIEYERFDISNGPDLDRPEMLSVGATFELRPRRGRADSR